MRIYITDEPSNKEDKEEKSKAENFFDEEVPNLNEEMPN